MFIPGSHLESEVKKYEYCVFRRHQSFGIRRPVYCFLCPYVSKGLAACIFRTVHEAECSLDLDYPTKWCSACTNSHDVISQKTDTLISTAMLTSVFGTFICEMATHNRAWVTSSSHILHLKMKHWVAVEIKILTDDQRVRLPQLHGKKFYSCV